MATKIYQCMQKISDAIVENKDFLTDLDREIGDADHGVNMARGFTEVMKQLPEDEAAASRMIHYLKERKLTVEEVDSYVE